MKAITSIWTILPGALCASCALALPALAATQASGRAPAGLSAPRRALTGTVANAASGTALLGGQVLDDGHGYPLYADVKVLLNGTVVANTQTTPLAGIYKVSLPAGNTYNVTVTPYLSGYTPGTATVTLNGNTRRDFQIAPDSSCGAPGYGYQFNEDFNEGSFPPAGWMVNTPLGSTVWELSQTLGDGNYTGGTGDAADFEAPIDYEPWDSRLVTPSIQVSDVGDSPVLDFLENVQIAYESFDVDISTDGGAIWTTIDHQTTNCGGFVGLPGCEKTYQLAPFLSGATSFQIRFRDYLLQGGVGLYAQVDDVRIGSDCTPLPGGLVIGAVRDANTNQALAGATVSDEHGISSQTTNIGGKTGFVQFEPAGAHTLTFSKPKYQDATRNISVANGAKLAQLAQLDAGWLQTRPTQATLSVPVNTQQTYRLNIRNTGTAPANWQVSSLNAPAPPDSPMSAPASGSAAWTAIADYPMPIEAACAVGTHQASGLIYVVDGYSNGAPTNLGYVYDPKNNSWTSIASAPAALDGPACAMIDGKIYMTEGQDANYDYPSALYIYDPETDSWSTGASIPHAAGAYASGVALNGKFYAIGGCNGFYCQDNSVEVYDPATNSWGAAADYPIDFSQNGCGALDGKIYCTGGFRYRSIGSAYFSTDVTVNYDPATNQWSFYTSGIPYENWAMAAIGTTRGKMMISGGNIPIYPAGGTYEPTNQAEIYDVTTDTWTALPDNPVTVSYPAGACGYDGFYTIGGNDTNGNSVSSAEVLPGYDVCSVQPVPWMTLAPASGTLAAHDAATATVMIDGTGQTPGTQSQVQIRVTDNTPYSTYTGQIIPVTVNWTSGGG
ncbi:MAG: Kelch repeat-containing protein [Gammaproteobacteria bacterium]